MRMLHCIQSAPQPFRLLGAAYGIIADCGVAVFWTLQGVQLKSLAVYFDCDKPLMDPGHRWDLITASRWDELMLPANQLNTPQQQQQPPQPTAAPAAAWVAGSSPDKPPAAPPPQQQQQAQPPHQFLLCPVDGTLRYVRRGRAARKTETDAEQEIHLQLVQIGLQVHQLQYQSSQKLLQEFDRYAASAPHCHLRPHCRPTTGMVRCRGGLGATMGEECDGACHGSTPCGSVHGCQGI